MSDGMGISMVKKGLVALTLALAAVAVPAGSSRLCTYEANASSTMGGKISLGYTGTSGELRTRGDHDQRQGLYFNVMQVDAHKGHRYKFSVRSRYFKPRIVVVDDRGRKTEGRLLGKTSGGWVSEAVYDADREYRTHTIAVHITALGGRQSSRLKGAEAFVKGVSYKEICSYLRDDRPGPPPKAPPGIFNPCPPGQTSILGAPCQ